MISFAELAEVEDIIRSVNEKAVLPRFRSLNDSDVAMKGPMDPVTVADREAEDLLRERLTAFLPGSVVVGEEAVSEDASVLDALTGTAPVWIVDPIDGTRNFVAGSGRFSTLVALAVGRRTAGFLDLRPGSGPHRHRTGRPRRAGGRHPGARGTGRRPRRRRRCRSPPATRSGGRTATAAASTRCARRIWTCRYFDACGIEYLDLANGSRSAMVLTWEYCWDHAAGLLLVAEAGGHVAALDGAPVRLEGGNALPFVVSTDPATTERIREIITESGQAAG